jgi:hypothetical protein
MIRMISRRRGRLGLCAASAAVAGLAASSAQAQQIVEEPFDQQEVAGSAPEGLANGMNGFSCATQGGQFIGLKITFVKPAVTRLRLSTFNGGETLFDGPIAPGQFIPLSTGSFVWTGFMSPNNGNDYGAIRVRPVCRK